MFLSEFLHETGFDNVAAQLGVSRQVVWEWSRYGAVPKPENAMKLIILSKGLLTWEDVYKPFAQKALHKTSFQVESGGVRHSVSFDFTKELKELGIK